jgi:uncharacterized protein YecT (DUF1311 family)
MRGRHASRAARTLGLVIAAAGPVPALAADAPAAFEACMDAARSTPAYAECTTNEIARQDRLLNDVWRRVSEQLKSFSAPSFNLLLIEQRKWVQWKDSACQYYQEGFGSEGRAIQYPLCFIKILRDRVAYLQALADQI